MNNKKLNRIINLSNQIRPKTYLEEFAESGWLEMYIDNYSKERMKTDKDYQSRIYDAFYNYSQQINEETELYFMNELCENLSFFLEYTKSCKTPKQ